MPMITITSDWNKNDYYLPALKGRLLSYFAACKKKEGLFSGEDFFITDISNNVTSFNVYEACFILRHASGCFPKGTIHLLAVNSEPLDDQKMAIVYANGYYFVSVNDGRFSLLLNNREPEAAFALEAPEKGSSFSALDLFCRAVEIIMEHKMDILHPCTLQNAAAECPVIMEDRIIGRVVYIDSYGNAITNISKEQFSKGLISMRAAEGMEHGFTIFIQGPYLKINKIYSGYNDVATGMDVAFFNSLGLLEIAINKGNFAAVEGIDTTAEVLIKFNM